MAQFQFSGSAALIKGALIAVLAILAGCTSADPAPRAPVSVSLIPGTAGEASLVFHNTTLQLLNLVQGIRQMQRSLEPGHSAIPFLQGAIDRLQTTLSSLSLPLTVPFVPAQASIPGFVGSNVYLAEVEVGGGHGFFVTAVAQNQGDRLAVAFIVDGYLTRSLELPLIAEDYQELAGTLRMDGLGGTLQHFTKVGIHTGPADAVWEWSYNPQGTSSIRISDGGPAAGRPFPRNLVLTFNQNFSGVGTITLFDGTASPFNWP